MVAGRDALFELTDAVIQSRQIQSFAELTCAPAFRRKWPSVYEAIDDGRPDREGMLAEYLKYLPEGERLILVGDHTAWERLTAETLKGRSYQHQPSAVPGRRPVTIGLGYSTLGVVPESQGSWMLPLLHERISDRKPVVKAAEQLQKVCAQISRRPLTLWDSEYSCGDFLLATADLEADKLMRLRTNLCLEGPPKPRKSKRGPEPKHGERFKFKDPQTWWEPGQELEYESGEFGPTKVRIWETLRFRKALDCNMTVAQVERLQAPGTRRKPRLLWFAWVGQKPPEHWWELYGRRYPVDHWYRFAKGRLHWTLPQFSTPERADRWSDLMPFITWELWFARQWVEDCPLPWQKPQKLLSPGRVCQGMQNILAAIGTPAQACKSRGISPGWPTGQPRSKRERYNLDQSERWRNIRSRQRAKKAGEKAQKGRPKQADAVQTA
jgi:hypothetical protein